MDTKEMIESIKDRLSMCENKEYKFEDFTLEFNDGCRYKCKQAWLGVDGELMLDFGVFGFGEDDILKNVKYLNAVFNAIQPRPHYRDIEDEIRFKVSCYPNGVYTTIPEDELYVTMDDENTFALIKIEVEDNRVLFELFSHYTEEFTVYADDIAEESLQEIADSIVPPREIIVDCKGVLLHSEPISRGFDNDCLEIWLKENLPLFDWEWDGDNQWTAGELSAFIVDEES